MNTITIELCADDRKRLDAILAALTARTESAVPKEPTPPTTTPEQDIEAAVPFDTKPEPVKPTVKLEDIQALVQKLATPSSGKRDAVRTLIKQYAERVTQIPTDKYDDVMAELVALDEGR